MQRLGVSRKLSCGSTLSWIDGNSPNRLRRRDDDPLSVSFLEPPMRISGWVSLLKPIPCSQRRWIHGKEFKKLNKTADFICYCNLLHQDVQKRGFHEAVTLHWPGFLHHPHIQKKVVTTATLPRGYHPPQWWIPGCAARDLFFVLKIPLPWMDSKPLGLNTSATIRTLELSPWMPLVPEAVLVRNGHPTKLDEQCKSSQQQAVANAQLQPDGQSQVKRLKSQKVVCHLIIQIAAWSVYRNVKQYRYWSIDWNKKLHVSSMNWWFRSEFLVGYSRWYR